MAVASNAPFSEWGQTFADPRLAAAVVDRLTFRAHIIETGSSSAGHHVRADHDPREVGPELIITVGPELHARVPTEIAAGTVKGTNYYMGWRP